MCLYKYVTLHLWCNPSCVVVTVYHLLNKLYLKHRQRSDIIIQWIERHVIVIISETSVNTQDFSVYPGCYILSRKLRNSRFKLVWATLQLKYLFINRDIYSGNIMKTEINLERLQLYHVLSFNFVHPTEKQSFLLRTECSPCMWAVYGIYVRDSYLTFLRM